MSVVFANHESIKAIKENNLEKNLTAENSHLPKVFACDVEQLLIVTNVNSNKSTSIGKIPLKLIKLSAKVLSKPLVITINNSFNKGMFPDNAKFLAFFPWINTLMINIL